MKPVIFGMEGPELTSEERKFFVKEKPFGYILFKRNCVDKEQLLELTGELKRIAENDSIPILIDQEGGRVARLKAPNFKEFRPASFFFDLARKDVNKALFATYLNYSMMAKELYELGITVNCAPVADILFPHSDEIIGDRSFGNNAELVTILATQACNALLDGGIYPVIKHIPGHGRANCDSHEELPVVDADLKTLDRTDFAVFRGLNKYPLAMTAHIVYSAIDDQPATLSNKCIKYIRQQIGFKNILMTDDLSMKALNGDLGELAIESLRSDCDLVLHCNGNIEEMKKIASSIDETRNNKLSKFIRHFKLRPKTSPSINTESQLNSLIESAKDMV